MLIVAILLLLVGLFFCFKVYQSYHYYELIAHTRVSTISDLEPGLVAVEGRICSPMKAVYTPYSDQECAFYHYELEELRYARNGKRRRRVWKTIETFYESAELILNDGSGEVGLKLGHAELDIKTNVNRESRDQFEKEGTLAAIGNFLTQSREFRHTEKILRPGDFVLVIGSSNFNRGVPFIEKGRERFLIATTRSWDSLKSKYMTSTFLLFIVACFFIGISLLILLSAFL